MLLEGNWIHPVYRKHLGLMVKPRKIHMILFDWHFQQHLPNKTHHLPWIHVTPVFLNIFTTTILNETPYFRHKIMFSHTWPPVPVPIKARHVWPQSFRVTLHPPQLRRRLQSAPGLQSLENGSMRRTKRLGLAAPGIEPSNMGFLGYPLVN